MGRNSNRLNRRRFSAPEPARARASGRNSRAAVVVPGGLPRGLKKVFSWSSRAALLLLVTAGAVSAGTLLERYVRRSEAFATREVEIEGRSRLSPEEVMRAADLAYGKNLFEVSPEQAREGLAAHPWIDEVKVVRRLPSTYRIQIKERQAIALLQLEAMYLVSERGSVFKRLEASDPVDLPVITGVDAAHFRSDLAFRRTLLRRVNQLLQDYRDAGLWTREPIAEIHSEPPHGFTVYVGRDAIQLRLGEAPFDRKLNRFREILDELKDETARPAYVVLDNVRRPDRVAVRLR
jgi:cell division protein FtsQ